MTLFSQLLGIIVFIAISILLVIMRFLRSWFARLDEESRFRISDVYFEDPSSLKRTPVPSLFDAATKSLSIVIPAYNEEDRLPSTVEETLAYLTGRQKTKGPSFTWEIVIVDDGSSDDTASTAFSFVKRLGFDAVRVLRLPKNRGKGYAVKAGMLCARGSNLLMMDADGATRVSDLEKLETKMEEITTRGKSMSGAEKSLPGFVLGSRAHLQEEAMAKRTWVRNIMMRGFHALVTLVVGSEIRDTQCGFKLFTRAAARLLFPNQRLQRWAFDVELVKLAQSFNVPTAEVQVAWTEIPGSKIRITSVVHIAFELAMIAVGYGSGVWRAEGPMELGKLTKKKV
jgi:dolichyl-phosphate beta-glucosyltransferase